MEFLTTHSQYVCRYHKSGLSKRLYQRNKIAVDRFTYLNFVACLTTMLQNYGTGIFVEYIKVFWHNLSGGFVVSQGKPQYSQRPGSGYNQVLPKAGQQHVRSNLPCDSGSVSPFASHQSKRITYIDICGTSPLRSVHTEGWLLHLTDIKMYVALSTKCDDTWTHSACESTSIYTTYRFTTQQGLCLCGGTWDIEIFIVVCCGILTNILVWW